jgi:hypothetical protein
VKAASPERRIEVIELRDADLVDFCLWFAETADGLEREDVERVFERARRRPA